MVKIVPRAEPESSVFYGIVKIYVIVLIPAAYIKITLENILD